MYDDTDKNFIYCYNLLCYYVQSRIFVLLNILVALWLFLLPFRSVALSRSRAPADSEDGRAKEHTATRSLAMAQRQRTQNISIKILRFFLCCVLIIFNVHGKYQFLFFLSPFVLLFNQIVVLDIYLLRLIWMGDCGRGNVYVTWETHRERERDC